MESDKGKGGLDRKKKAWPSKIACFCRKYFGLSFPPSFFFVSFFLLDKNVSLSE